MLGPQFRLKGGHHLASNLFNVLISESSSAVKGKIALMVPTYNHPLSHRD